MSAFTASSLLQAETEQALQRIDEPALLLFTLGPVQDFIAAARRTSDLRAGSYLLSVLTAQALRPVWERVGTGAILFPDLAAEEKLLAVWNGSGGTLPADLALPNRFLALVPAADAERLARQAEAAARSALHGAVESVRRKLDRTFSEATGWDEAHHFLEASWAAAPYAPSQGYAAQYVALEQAVGGTKALRAFEAAPSSGFRDSLSPSLGALIPQGHPTQRQVNDFWKRRENRGYLRLRGGEQLSALSLTKRLLRSVEGIDADEAFPSTASLATADFKRGILQALRGQERATLLDRLSAFIAGVECVQSLLGEQRTYLKEAPLPLLDALAQQAGSQVAATFAALPGDWLYAETLTPDGARRAFGIDRDLDLDTRSLDEARSRLRKLVETAQGVGIGAPSRYYGCIVFDGDRMGTWLSGEHSGLDGHTMTPATHRAVSQSLATFARGLVPHLVQTQYLGKLVYSGGDDVLCFVSFDDALPLLEALRAAFSGHVTLQEARYEVDWRRASADVDLPPGTSWPEGVPARVLGPRATASAGFYLAHQQEPLSDVLDAAREAEKHAKRTGRNRTALAVGRRSGGTVTAPLVWPVGHPGDATRPNLLPAMTRLVEAIREGHLSSGFLYDARETIAALPDAAVSAELRRLFGRRTERLDAGAHASRQHAVLALWDATLAPLLEATRQPEAPHAYQPQKALDLVQVAVVLGKGGDRQ